jgi:hypothetical protein
LSSEIGLLLFYRGVASFTVVELGVRKNGAKADAE